MKRIIAVIVLSIMIFTLASCGGEKKKTPKEEKGCEAAMIVNGDKLEEGSFSHDTWKSFEKISQENNLTCKYYGTENPSKDTYLVSIQKAVDDGAKFIVLPGSAFETAAYAAQTTYPDVHFLIIDGVPHDEAGTYATAANTISIIFAEEEAGYLAGYAAVKEGYTKLGFMGGQELPSIKRYGYGFAQGAAAAAAEMETKTELIYRYVGSFDESDAAQKMASDMYAAGTEVIFVCGGAMTKSVAKAAEEKNGKVIGADIDQSMISNTVITSAEKNLDTAISDVLKRHAEEKFVGGMAFNYAVKNKGINMEMKNAKLSKFTEDDYKAVLKKLKNNKIELKKDTGVKAVTELAGDWLAIK